MCRKVILVVDGDQNTIRTVESALASPYDIVTAKPSEDISALAQNTQIHLAVISCDLPRLESFALFRSMAKKFPALPIVLVAKNASKEFIVSAFRLGARDVLEKPLTTEIVLESVCRVLGARMNGGDHFDSHAGAVSPTSKAPSRLIFFRRWTPHVTNWMHQVVDHFRPNRNGVLVHANAASVSQQVPVLSPAESPAKGEPEESPEKCRPIHLETKTSEDLLRAYCLGRFQILINEQLVEHWPCRKDKDLFAYLTVNHGRRTCRDVLMDHFWPASTPDSARNSLNVAIHGVRHRLREVDQKHEYIIYENECYFLNPGLALELDIDEFMRYWRLAQEAERENLKQSAIANYELAAALYQGDFMEENLYDSWPTLQRENLKEIYLVILDRLSQYDLQAGKLLAAVMRCEKILEKDNCREDVYRRLMRCHYKMGQRDKALKIYHKCAEALKAELEIEPASATQNLFQQIRNDRLREPGETKHFSGI